MVARRRKAARVDSGPSAEDMQFGRLAVMYDLGDSDTLRYHDHAEEFPDPALEAEAREFAERHRHMWADW